MSRRLLLHPESELCEVFGKLILMIPHGDGPNIALSRYLNTLKFVVPVVDGPGSRNRFQSLTDMALSR
jgi:hypothetical protein